MDISILFGQIKQSVKDFLYNGSACVNDNNRNINVFEIKFNQYGINILTKIA